MSVMSLKHKFKANKVYQINLDLPPAERWIQLLEDHKEEMKTVVPQFKHLVSSMFGSLIYPAIGIIKTMKVLRQILYADEIQSIATFIGMTFEEVLLLQICYELNSCCTSVVTKYNNDYVFFRTMDWPLDFLNKITIDLEFIKNGNLLYKATSWVGYLGVATATVPGKYSIAMNFRLTKERTITNLMGNVGSLIGLKWPTGYLIREVCESNTDYDTMLVQLSNSKIVSPCYLTVCGVTDKPKIITRDPDDYKITRGEFTVQTNCDQCKEEPDILHSVEIRALATLEINQTQNNWSSLGEMQNRLLKYPIVNNETIYYSLMIPRTGKHESYTYFPR